MGWERYVGSQGTTVTLNHFGASAPAKTVFQQFGFTADNIVEQAKKLL
jgi:transketolase